MLIKILLLPEDNGDEEHTTLSVIADASMTQETVKAILRLSVDVVETGVVQREKDTIQEMVNQHYRSKFN